MVPLDPVKIVTAIILSKGMVWSNAVCLNQMPFFPLFLITACSMVIPCPTPSSCLCIFVIFCQKDRHSCTDPKDAALAKVLRGQSFWAWRSGTQGVDNAYSPTHTAPPPFFSLHCSYFLWSAVSYSDFFVMKYCICLFHILYLRWEYLNTHSVLIIA